MSTAGELGERKIIELIIENLEKMPSMPIPFGDDISAIPLGRGRLAVVKTDMLIGKTDVPPRMAPRQIARKAVVMNISDLASKGVGPTAVLVSLGVPKDYSKKHLIDIGRGLNDGAREYNAYVIGGDTAESSDLIISCMVVGTAMERTIIRRSGARAGDILATTGLFGKTAAGLKILLNKLDAPKEIRKNLLDAVYMPRARLREGLALARSGTVTASIDSSDGLAFSLHELHKMSHVGFKLTHLPLSPDAKRFADIHNLNEEDLALFGGEEYELIVTVKPDKWLRAERAVKRVGGRLIRIGYAAQDTAIALKVADKERPIPPRGYEHFRE